MKPRNIKEIEDWLQEFDSSSSSITIANVPFYGPTWGKPIVWIEQTRLAGPLPVHYQIHVGVQYFETLNTELRTLMIIPCDTFENAGSLCLLLTKFVLGVTDAT